MLRTDFVTHTEQPCLQVLEGDVNLGKVGVGVVTVAIAIENRGSWCVARFFWILVAVLSINVHHCYFRHVFRYDPLRAP